MLGNGFLVTELVLLTIALACLKSTLNLQVLVSVSSKWAVITFVFKRMLPQ